VARGRGRRASRSPQPIPAPLQHRDLGRNLARYPNVYAEWSPNEKVGVDVAVGAAYAGRRGAGDMKHVGVNVAADSVFYASMTGMEAGLVIVTADDPAMHSSQNEQDNRRYSKFARIPAWSHPTARKPKRWSAWRSTSASSLTRGLFAADHPRLPFQHGGGAY